MYVYMRAALRAAVVRLANYSAIVIAAPLCLNKYVAAGTNLLLHHNPACALVHRYVYLASAPARGCAWLLTA